VLIEGYLSPNATSNSGIESRPSFSDMEQISLQFTPERQIFTVSELNAAVRSVLDSEFQDVWVAGEISGVRLASSGHYYFTLKDEVSQLRCVCFRLTARYLRFKPQDGVAVLARGRIDVYETRGEYQLLVETLEPQGYGALQLAFEQLKKKLAQEGLFDASRKRPLRKLPERIGIVTSPKGAAIRDILHILERRFPGLHIRIYPAQVQGESAVQELTAGIDWFSESGWADVVIVARGGGSLEDLWTFNDEAIARAIAGCSVPVISAVGHETDVTIADFVADLRAPTPSAAAELVICTKEQLLEQIASAISRIEQAIRYRLADASRRLHRAGIDAATAALHRSIGRYSQRVDELDYQLRDRLRVRIRQEHRRFQELDWRLRKIDPRTRVVSAWRRVEQAEAAAAQHIRLRLAREHGRLESLSAHLSQLSPLKVLDRGYAIVRDEQGKIVKAAEDAPADSALEIRLAKGRLRTRVTESIPDDNSELPS
jgi:exodeoxyribonuclease VII large subunit